MRGIVSGVLFLVMSVQAVWAQDQQSAWVQIEAQRSLVRALEVARGYSDDLQSVAGFTMRSGWYAIAIGPFSPTDAENVLQQLRVTRQVPGDAYVVDGSQFGRQFWPIGASANAPAIVPLDQPVQEAVAGPLIAARESVAQARRAESRLSRDERKDLQRALRWEGFYASAIDGAIGPGTRRSMAAWQRQVGFEATGVLTTIQRRDLLARFQDMLASLGMTELIDNTAGIQIELPTALVAFDRYEPPFAHFKAKGASGVQVLLISQTGDDATLRGLYDIMQTLDIVPLDGARRFGRRDFTLTGQDSEITSYTFAALAAGHVKGFTLIWPGPPDRRRDMVLNAMQASFTPIRDAVLPDVIGSSDTVQSLDLMAGLTIRQPDAAASGFYVNASGHVLTAAQNVTACTRITIDDNLAADIAAIDQNNGLALLRPAQALAPIAIANLADQIPRLNTEIAVSGYSYGGLLGSPTLTYGTLDDVRGLNGDAAQNRLSLDATASDSGGPVFAADGSVLGLLLPKDAAGARLLPKGVRFAANATGLSEFLSANGISAVTAGQTSRLDPEDLSLIAADMTVLISCWN